MKVVVERSAALSLTRALRPIMLNGMGQFCSR